MNEENQNMPTQTPTPEPVATPPEAPLPPVQTEMPPVAPPAQGGIGPMIGIIIVVLVLVLGGLYFWGVQVTKQDTPAYPAEINEDVTVPLSTTDSIDALEADLANTNTEALDTELDQIGAELDAELDALSDELGAI